MRILVIGGTSLIGRRLVDALLAAGNNVTALHRSPDSKLAPGVEGLLADRNDPEAVRRVLTGRRFEAVFDNVYDFGRGTTAAQVAAAAQACAGPQLERYVFMSTVGAYEEGLDLSEDAPLAPPDDPKPYSANKASSERALFSMPGLPAVTIRPPFVYGPGNPFYREAFFWERLRDRRPILVPEDGKRLMQFVHADDIVQICMRILERPAAVGHAFNAANHGPVTQEQAVRAIAAAAGYEPQIVYIPREKALAAGGSPMGPKLYFAHYFDLPPITIRIDKARGLLGFEPIPFNDGLRGTYAWWLEHNPFPTPDYSFEDSLLNAIT